MFLRSDFDPVEYLFSLQHSGVKLGIERMKVLVEKLGHPEKQFKSIHIAGTNGKGSCAAMLASIYQKHGYKVGMNTSPHLEFFNERIQINGNPISNQDLLDLVVEIRKILGDEETTFFEFTTAIAFLYFARQKVDIAIIEVGLGGRLDATNVITPNLTVITSIDLDHTRILGSTLKEIAIEKAGIIKSGVPLVCGELRPDLQDMFKEICREKKSAFHLREFDYQLTRSGLFGQCFIIEGIGYTLGLLGEHQIENALTVLKCVQVMNNELYVSKESIDLGLLEAKWPGRLQVYSYNPLVIMDGAHNGSGMNYLCKFLDENEEELLENRKRVCIVGISNGKDIDQMLKNLSKYFDSIIVVQAEHRFTPKEEVAKVAKNYFSEVQVAEICDAMALTKEKIDKDGFILVSGSLYVIGDILREINKKKSGGLNLKGAIGNV